MQIRKEWIFFFFGKDIYIYIYILCILFFSFFLFLVEAVGGVGRWGGGPVMHTAARGWGGRGLSGAGP